MFCKFHPQRIAIEKCRHCGAPICENCENILKGKFFCPECANLTIPGVHTVAERDPYKAAVLSFFIPGAGQVYNGQLEKGLRIFFFCWLVLPWVYGIVDAFQTAQRINNHTIFARPSIKDAVAFLLVAAVVCVGVGQIFRYADSGGFWESAMEKDLRTLSQAVEQYKEDHGLYPENFSQLYFSSPAYVSAPFCDTERNGFKLTCEFMPQGYTLTAKPVDPRLRQESYVITAGGVMRTGIF